MSAIRVLGTAMIIVGGSMIVASLSQGLNAVLRDIRWKKALKAVDNAQTLTDEERKADAILFEEMLVGIKEACVRKCSKFVVANESGKRVIREEIYAEHFAQTFKLKSRGSRTYMRHCVRCELDERLPLENHVLVNPTVAVPQEV